METYLRLLTVSKFLKKVGGRRFILTLFFKKLLDILESLLITK